jgi:hypothetical protein
VEKVVRAFQINAMQIVVHRRRRRPDHCKVDVVGSGDGATPEHQLLNTVVRQNQHGC